jgi:uncharacterized membrane protein YdfJ with MMPL/SSD domain
VFDALAVFVYRLRWLIVVAGVALLALSYAGRDEALESLSTHIGVPDDTESARAQQIINTQLANGGGDVMIVFDAATLSARGATADQYQQLVTAALAPVTAEIAQAQQLPANVRGGRPTNLRTFYQNGTPLQVAPGDPKITLALVDLAGTDDQKKNGVLTYVLNPLESHFRTLAHQNPRFASEFGAGQPGQFRIYVTGNAATSAESVAISQRDASRADKIALPLTLVLLVLIFGGLIAAVQPLFIGFLAAGVAIVFLGVMNRLFTVSNVAGTVTAVLGLGLAIDYALLMVTRFREELRHTGLLDHPNPTRGEEADAVLTALKRTLNSAGRSVLFSGIAVAIGLNSLVFIPLLPVRSLAVGGSVTALFAITGALIILPAVLAITGPNIDRFNVLGFRRSHRVDEAAAGTGLFTRVAGFVSRLPLPITIVTVAVLLLFALPARAMQLGVSDYRILPEGSPVREGYEALVQGFGTGLAEPVKIVYQAPNLETVDGIGAFWDYVHQQVMTQPGIARGADGVPAVESAVSALDGQLAQRGLTPPQQRQFYQTAIPLIAQVNQPQAIPLPPGVTLPPGFGPPGATTLPADEVRALLAVRDAVIKGNTALVQVATAGDPQGATAKDLVRRLRDDRPPPPATTLIGGTPATSVDYVRAVTRNVPLMVLFIFVLTYLVLWALLGSVVLPLIGFVLNVISLGASFGALVFIFQEGNFAGLLDFTRLDILDATTPVVLFAVTFALSMDYQVFLLSRIKEEYDATGDVRAGIVNGLARTAGIVTGAALTLLGVLAAYGTATNALVKSLTVGMFVAVLVDATIVRTFLVPAVLMLFGRAAWWSPAGLRRVWSRLGLSERGA